MALQQLRSLISASEITASLGKGRRLYLYRQVERVFNRKPSEKKKCDLVNCVVR